jgi:hypothetical protein
MADGGWRGGEVCVLRRLCALNTSIDSPRCADHVGVRRIARRRRLIALHRWVVSASHHGANGSLPLLSTPRSQLTLTLRAPGDLPCMQRRAEHLPQPA